MREHNAQSHVASLHLLRQRHREQLFHRAEHLLRSFEVKKVTHLGKNLVLHPRAEGGKGRKM